MTPPSPADVQNGGPAKDIALPIRKSYGAYYDRNDRQLWADDLMAALNASSASAAGEGKCGYASFRNHTCALPFGHDGEHNTKLDRTGTTWGTDPDDLPLKASDATSKLCADLGHTATNPCPSCAPDAKELRQQHPMWDLLQTYGDACEELATRDSYNRDERMHAVNDAWEAIWQRLSHGVGREGK